MSQFFDRFGGGDTLVYADPAMADNGVLYTGFTPEFALEMGKLCGKADVIVPNLTEAAFMLGEEYVGDDYDEAYVHALLKRLTGLGCKTAILTGISYQPGQIGAVAYDSVTDTYASYFNEKLPVRFHGTGDVFSSVLTGALVRGESLSSAAGEAAAFVRACAERTATEDLPMREGVDFEPLLGLLIPGKETV